MKKTLMLFGICCLVLLSFSQTENEVTNTNGIKLGSFYQTDFYYSYDHYDYYYYTSYTRVAPGGYFYIAYDYTINYKNGKALSIEPKIGLMLIRQQTGMFVGNDVKFFWYSNGFYRFGASFYVGYRYITMDKTATISMENGMYQRTLSYVTNIHHIDTDIAMIPFQFNFKSGFNLECHVGMGFTWRIENPQDSPFKSNIKYQLDEVSFYPYFPKIGLKLGYTF
jgi:hypothetical protein